MLRMLGAALLAAIVVFTWGFVFWTVLPIGAQAVQGPPDSPALQKVLDAQLPASGMYMVPWSDSPQSDTAYHQQHTRGPLALVQFRKTGAEPMAPGILIQGFVHGFVSLLLMAVVVRVASAGGGFGTRWIIASGAGLAVAVFAALGDAIWWYQPWGFAVTQLIYTAVAWLLGGLVLAVVLRPTGQRPDPNRL